MRDEEGEVRVYVEGMLMGIISKHDAELAKGDIRGFLADFEKMVAPVLRRYHEKQGAKNALKKAREIMDSDAQDDESCDGKSPSCTWEHGRRYAAGVINDELKLLGDTD